MAYWNGECDECGAKADYITPMYCLCSVCFDTGDFEEEEDA